MATLEDAIKKIQDIEPYSGSLLTSDLTLAEYCKQEQFGLHTFSATHLERQRPYKEIIRDKVERICKHTDVRVNFEGGLILDTVDHHGIMNYPVCVGAHVVGILDTIFKRETHGDFFVLASGNVSLNNLAHRRGVSFNGVHLNLFPKKDKNRLIARYPLYSIDLLKSAKNSGHAFSEEEVSFLQETQHAIDEIDFSTCRKFSDQATLINYHLWKQFFGEDVRDSARRCVMMEHDDMLIDYLTESLTTNSDTLMWRMLFDEQLRTRVLKEFNGIYGAWGYGGDDAGTHFFWGYSEHDQKRHQLTLQGNTLISSNNVVDDIPLTPEAITQALVDGILIPSVFTKFSTVAFYMGAKLLGGVSQVEYTQKMKEAWLRVLKDVDIAEHALVSEVSVRNMVLVEMPVCRDTSGNLRRAYGLDVAYRHILTQDYIQKILNTPFKYLLYPFIPDYYGKVTTLDNREVLEYDEAELYQGFSWIK